MSRLALLLFGIAASCGSEAPEPAPLTARVPAPVARAEPWRAVLEAVIARAGEPAPVESFATSDQERAIGQARLLARRLYVDPEDRGARLALARVYHQAWFPGRALAVLGAHLAKHPDDALALRLAAASLLVEQDLPGALALLERADELDPGDLDGDATRISILRRQGRVDEACALAERALERHPFAGELELPLAARAFERGDFEAAERRSATVLRSSPDSLEALFLRARALRALGRDAEAADAEATHARLSRLDDLGLPEGLGPDERRIALARHYRWSGELARAEEELRAVLSRRLSRDAASELVLVLEAQGRDPEAELAALRAAHPHLSELELPR